MPKFNKKDPDLDEVAIVHENDLDKIPDRIVVPQCKVCSSKYRDDVDLWIARGYSMSSIRRALEGAGVDISITSISRHRDNHLPMKLSAYREILENNIVDYQKAQGEGAIRMISGAAVLDMIIAKAPDLLLNDTTDLEIKDIIKAIEVKSAMEEKGIVEFQAKVVAQVDAIRIAMEEILGEEEARSVLARASEVLEQKASGDYTPKTRDGVVVLPQETIEEGTIEPAE